MVAAVDAAGCDHAQRRFAFQHGDDLHIRGLRAQQQRAPVAGARQVEGVVVGARRVMARDVQGAEVEPVGLDVEAFADGEPHGAEDGGHFLHGAADRVDQAERRGAGRQGDIEALGREAGVERRVFENGAAGVDGGGEAVLEAVQRGAALFPLLRRGFAERAQQSGQAPRLAQCRNPDRIPGLHVDRRGKRRLSLGLDGH